jgi:hypothetical protein
LLPLAGSEAAVFRSAEGVSLPVQLLNTVLRIRMAMLGLARLIEI